MASRPSEAHDLEACPQTLIRHFKPHPLEPHLAARRERAHWCCSRQDRPRVSAKAAQWIKARHTKRSPPCARRVMEVTDIHRSSCLLHAPTTAPPMELSRIRLPMAPDQRVPALQLPLLRLAHALKGHATNSAGRAIHSTGSIGPLRPHRAPSTTPLMLASCMRPHITPERRLPAAERPLLRPTRAGRRDLVARAETT